MTSTTFFIIFIPILAIILLSVNLLLAPHNPYQEKDSAFECGFKSFLGQNRTQFSVSFFIFALLFLLFDLEILLVYPYSVSGYTNDIYGLTIMLIFFVLLTLGFIFELGKNALTIESRQTSLNTNENVPSPHAFISLSLQSKPLPFSDKFSNAFFEEEEAENDKYAKDKKQWRNARDEEFMNRSKDNITKLKELKDIAEKEPNTKEEVEKWDSVVETEEIKGKPTPENLRSEISTNEGRCNKYQSKIAERQSDNYELSEDEAGDKDFMEQLFVLPIFGLTIFEIPVIRSLSLLYTLYRADPLLGLKIKITYNNLKSSEMKRTYTKIIMCILVLFFILLFLF